MAVATTPDVAVTLTLSGEAASPGSAGFELVEHMARHHYVVELGGPDIFGTTSRAVQLEGVSYDEEYGAVLLYRLWDEEKGEAAQPVWRVRWSDVESMHVW